MATDSLRRSTRVRKPVKSYADEQAEAEERVLSAPPAKGVKTKKNIDAYVSPLTDDDDEASTEALRHDDAGVEIVKVSTKKRKKANAADEEDEDTAAAQPTRKRKAATKGSRPSTDRSWHADAAATRIIRTKQKARKLKSGEEETRLRAYIDAPSDRYYRFVESANTQRMFVIDRERGVEEGCHAHHESCPCETLQIAGSTGNVYTVTISHLPSCSCPVGIFWKKGQEQCCKHVLYVLHHVLKAPDELKYQNAFLTSELFENAPALPSEVADDEPKDGNGKPVEDDCPICCMEFDEASNEIVWCRAACGNNVHKECFGQWAKTKAGNVTCPFCRIPWQYGDKAKKQNVNVSNVDVPDEAGAGGCRNVRHLLEYDD